MTVEREPKSDEEIASEAAAVALAELSADEPTTGEPTKEPEEQARPEDWREFAAGAVAELFEILSSLNPGWRPIEKSSEEEKIARLSAPVFAKYAPGYFEKWRHELFLGVAIVGYVRRHARYVEAGIDPNAGPGAEKESGPPAGARWPDDL